MFSKRKDYLKALNNAYEYISVENIIGKLQEIDKIKRVLLNYDQRKVFEILPKPGIGESKKENSDFLSTNDASSNPMNAKFSKTLNTDLNFLLNGDPINQRLLKMLNVEVRNELLSKREGI